MTSHYLSNKQSRAGFIALMSVIIISVILLLVATSLSFAGFYGRFNVLDSEFKARSAALADGCADTAILRLASNPSYVPTVSDMTVAIGAESCTIQSITSLNTQRIILIQAAYQNVYTKLKVTYDTTNSAVLGWEELP